MVEVRQGTSVAPVRAGAGIAGLPTQRSVVRPVMPADPEPRAISVRRLMRWALVVGAFLVAALIFWQDPGYAHNGTTLTIKHDAPGALEVSIGLVSVALSGAAGGVRRPARGPSYADRRRSRQ